MAANMSIPLGDQLQFENVMHYVHLGAKDALTAFTSSTKLYLILYLGTTVLSLVLDLVCFFSQVNGFGNPEEGLSPFADLTLVMLAALFLFIDWYYILWVMSLTYKFPGYIASSAIQIFLGLIENIHQGIGRLLAKEKHSFHRQELHER